MSDPDSEPVGEPEPTSAVAVPERLSDRRRLIQRAIKDGGPPPPGLEDVAMQIAVRQAALRWVVVLYAVGFLVELTSVFVEHGTGTRLRDGVIALLFLLLGYQQWRVGARAKAAVARWDVPRGSGLDAAPGAPPDADPGTRPAADTAGEKRPDDLG